MDLKEYISSGILESYVLGMCNAQEAQEVEQMLAKHAELREELASIENALNAYASAHAKQPGDYLRDRILANFPGGVQDPPPLKVVYKAETKTPPAADSRYRMFVAASLTLFAISFIGNIILYNKYRSVNQELIALNNEKQVLADQYKVSQTKLDDMQSSMSMLSDPATEKIMMKGLTKSPESLAMIYWNRETGKVLLEVKQLPQPASGKQYQLWAIVDGKPVDAGMITVTPGDSSLHPMKDFSSAQAFAITLENEGGSPSPTMDEMYVLGQVSL